VLTVIEAIKEYVRHKNMVLNVYGLMYKMKHNLINTFHSIKFQIRYLSACLFVYMITYYYKRNP